MSTVRVTAGVRSPHGRFGGRLREVAMVELAVPVAIAALARSGVPPEAIDEVILAHRHQAGNGPNPARTVAVRAGVPLTTPAATVNMACASGLHAVTLARRAILAGDAERVLVVAADSMSTMPYYAPSRLRWEGQRLRDVTLTDAWRDGRDPLSGLVMGQTAERLVAAAGITRSEQDAWALRSHRRAAAAWDAGRFTAEVLPVALDGVDLAEDEPIRRETSAARLAALPPAFEPDGGTVTAGNASQMGDGAAAVVVARPASLPAAGAAASVALRSVAAVGVEPALMGTGPVAAVPLALARAGIGVEDVATWEINEAFAAQLVHNVRALGLDPERVNPDGGAIALAHPTGATGARLLVTAAHRLLRTGERFAVVALCVGGGQGVAAVLERTAP